MVPVTLVMGRYSAHVLLRGPDVRVRLQVGVGVVPHNMLLPPKERGHTNLHTRQMYRSSTPDAASQPTHLGCKRTCGRMPGP